MQLLHHFAGHGFWDNVLDLGQQIGGQMVQGLKENGTMINNFKTVFQNLIMVFISLDMPIFNGHIK